MHPPAPDPPARFGVGIDTSRYGHYAAFLRHDLSAAAGELPFPESAQGYQRLRERLALVASRAAPRAAHFVIRLDAAGQYADNLLHFLGRLDAASGHPDAIAARVTLSAGDPQRNKNYRAALFGGKKSDAVEARACARFAAAEQPDAATLPSAALRLLRQVAGRLQATVRQRTRLINQLHQLLAVSFPELALLIKDISKGWVLELLHRYPTAPLLAAATAADLDAIAYLPQKHAGPLLEYARASVGSLAGPAMEELVRDQVRQLRDCAARQQRLEALLVAASGALPVAALLDTIPGIGPVTAAVLVSAIADIGRFEGPGKLVAYFGVLPIEMSSGIDREGTPRGSRRWAMSKRGNDLVRRYLWMAALSAVQVNPAVRPLYQRVAAKHPDHKAIAIGHAMRKLLHLVFALWKTGKPFDASGHAPADAPGGGPGTASPAPEPAQEQAAGHKPDVPARTVVTAACAGNVAGQAPAVEREFIDFAHLKRQLTLERVLDQAGLLGRLRGSGPQRRGACPLHRGDGRGRTFSVNLEEGVFCCHAGRCGKKGDAIDLWAALHQRTPREAAEDLVRTFALEPAPG